MLITQLPKTYIDEDTKDEYEILARIPHTLAATLNVASSTTSLQFASNAFLQNVGKIFEIAEVIPRASFIDGSNNPLTATGASPSNANTADWYAKLKIEDTGHDSLWTPTPQLIVTMYEADNQVWTLAFPSYMKPGAQFNVFADNINTSTAVQVALSFRGSLLKLGKCIKPGAK